jgi:hypothetical protein
VADETDFLDLYRKLRLEPGCSLDDFKQAYRRHVAMWHPDRRRGSRADALAAARLQRLTAQYGAAMDFHRRHGRLPGAPYAARQPDIPAETFPAEVDLADAPLAEPVAASASEPPPAPAPPSARGLSTRWWLLIIVGCIGATVWSMWPASEEFEGESYPAAAAPMHLGEDAPQETLSLGMTPEEVLAIEGEPTHKGEDRWEYGPSWVRFEQGAVADWYSSPLRSLRVSSSKPRP